MTRTLQANNCQLGHAHHEVIEVDTIQGRFRAYDSARYMGAVGMYCTGQDVVSDRLAAEGWWEPHDAPVIEAILRDGDRGRLVIDFGAHIGWYTIMAAKLGYTVFAVDADGENLELLRQTAALHHVSHMITTMHVWVDEDFGMKLGSRDVELVKIDIEGNDAHAVNACLPFIDRVQNMYIEISPIFNDGYPAMMDTLTAAGFTAFWPDGREYDNDWSLTQFNLRFSRV